MYTPGYIPQVILLVLMVLGGYYFIRFLFSPCKGYCGSLLAVFIIINLIYYVLGFVIDFGVPDYSSLANQRLKYMLMAVFAFYPPHFSSVRKRMTDNKLFVWGVIYLIVALLRFYHFRLDSIEKFGQVVTNNIGYAIACLLPTIMFFDGNIVRWLCEFVAIWFAAISAKRGAILIAIVAVFIEYFRYGKASDEKFSIWRRVFFVLLVCVAVYFTLPILAKNDLLVHRIEYTEELGSSGRDEIAKNIWNYWLASPSVNKFLGNGFCFSTIASGDGHYAHNDYLEFLINFGILGVVSYGLFVASLMTLLPHLKDQKNRCILLLAIACLGVKSMTAGGCFGDSFLYFYIFGVFSGMVNQNKNFSPGAKDLLLSLVCVIF